MNTLSLMQATVLANLMVYLLLVAIFYSKALVPGTPVVEVEEYYCTRSVMATIS